LPRKIYDDLLLVTSYKVTTTAAQFTFFKCKFDFTTAEIVISYTLK